MEAPRDDLVRARTLGFELRTDDDNAMPTLFGHFARFNEWTEIHSWFEGDFMEMLAPGSFKRTIAQNRDAVKVLYDHGHDFNIGNKVLGPIETLREDGEGAFYEVPLLDTSYNRDLLPGLEAGLYGASFRFRVIKDEWNDEPGRSDDNPDGLPERTIREVRLYEFGPVTFPAYDTATAGVRSLTDDWLEHRLRANPQALARLAERAPTLLPAPASGTADPATDPADATPKGMTPEARSRVLKLTGVI